MKLGVVVLNIIFTVMSINSAVAGGRYGQHYSNHYSGHGNYYGRQHGYSSHYSYGPRRHYGHYNSHGLYAAYALGGLIVGGIIGAAISHSFNKGTRYPSYGESAYYVTPYPVENVIKPSYIIQPNGLCYLISHVSNGNLVLSPASPRSCQ